LLTGRIWHGTAFRSQRRGWFFLSPAAGFVRFYQVFGVIFFAVQRLYVFAVQKDQGLKAARNPASFLIS
jgi:hypothetical protein